MVDLELLAKRARRAAEWGRLRVASRTALVVVPLALIALVAGTPAPAVAVIGAALVILTIGLGWWSAEGGRCARSGLRLGAVPMAASLITLAVEGAQAPNPALTVCGAGCLVASLIAGGGCAWYAVRNAPPLRWWARAETGLVASITTALGCVGLGVGSALAVIGAVAVGATVGWIPARART